MRCLCRFAITAVALASVALATACGAARAAPRRPGTRYEPDDAFGESRTLCGVGGALICAARVLRGRDLRIRNRL
jgi:hypothetical protein